MTKPTYQDSQVHLALMFLKESLGNLRRHHLSGEVTSLEQVVVAHANTSGWAYLLTAGERMSLLN